MMNHFFLVSNNDTNKELGVWIQFFIVKDYETNPNSI